MIHVPARLRDAVRANRGEYLVSVRGPCSADLTFFRLCGAEIPERNPLVPGSDERQDPGDEPEPDVVEDR